MDEILTEPKDTQLATIEKNIPPIQAKVEALVVKDEHSSKFATDLGNAIKTYRDAAEKRRKFLKEDILRAGKKIDNEFMPAIRLCDELIEKVKEKIHSYIIAHRAEEERAAKEKQERLDKIAKATGLPPVQVEPKPLNGVQSSLGNAFTRKSWAWKIIDEKKIPHEYFILDDKRINFEVRAHTRVINGISTNNLVINGIEVYQEEDISFRK